MKEIVNRLHENRQVALAKSILEEAGYSYSLKEEMNESYKFEITADGSVIHTEGGFESEEEAQEEAEDYIDTYEGDTDDEDSYTREDLQIEVFRESHDTEYSMYQKLYKKKKAFEDRERQSGNIRDYLEDLDAQGLNYEIYFDRTDKGITVFHDSVDVKSGDTTSFDMISVGDLVKWDTKEMQKIPEVGELFRVGPINGNCTAVEDGSVVMKVTSHSFKENRMKESTEMDEDALLAEVKKVFDKAYDMIMSGDQDTKSSIVKMFQNFNGRVKTTFSEKYNAIYLDGNVFGRSIGATIHQKNIYGDAQRLATDIAMAYYRSKGGEDSFNTVRDYIGGV